MTQDSNERQICHFYSENFQLPIVFVSLPRGKMTTVGGGGFNKVSREHFFDFLSLILRPLEVKT